MGTSSSSLPTSASPSRQGNSASFSSLVDRKGDMAPCAARLVVGLGCVIGVSGCGDVFFAEVEAPEVCVTYPDKEMPAAPIAHSATVESHDDISIGESLPLDLQGADF